MYDWLVSILDFPADADAALVYVSALLVVITFAFVAKLLYKAVFR